MQDPTLLTLLTKASDGKSTEELIPYLYGELRRLAQSLLSRTPRGQTIQATALVHEAYLRLIGPDTKVWPGKPQFFAAIARSMRDILVENARRKAAEKRGGDLRRTQQDIAAVAIEPPSTDMLALDAALERLKAVDPVKAQLVDLRFFAGLNDDEIGEVLGCSARTVQREWRFARAWLQTELDPAAYPGADDPA